MSAQEGFLSPEFSKTVAQIRRDHRAWFDMLNMCNRLAMDVLPCVKPGTSDNQKLLEAGLYGRAVQSFQAIALLGERGMSGDARTVLRSLCETVIVQRRTAQDARFVDKLVERHDYHRRTLGNALLRDRPAMANMDSEQVRKLQAVIEEITAQYPAGRPTDINLADEAATAGGTAMYNVIFRPTSGDAAHAGLNALDRHFAVDEKDKISGLRFGPDASELADTLSLAISLLLHVMDSAIESFSLAEFRAGLAGCLESWKTLTGSN
jgi:hypothetical protein